MGVLQGQRVLIQFQDITGNWLTVNSIDDDNGQYVYQRMSEVARSYNGKRVRAIYERGGVIDIM
jgi:hypothetical protein